MNNKSYDKKILSSRIIKLRKSKRISQLNLAMRIGITQESISSIERGNSLPKCSTLFAIAKTLDCSIDYLLGVSDIKNPAFSSEILASDEKHLLDNFKKCDSKNKELLILISDFLTNKKIIYQIDDDTSVIKNFLSKEK